ncbi:hypothetical protein DB30_03617 [Enhygromyxa salina]|uniref:Fibronectin type-III domain-containing protein n=1 Tax=Enhygromyxa salina TaxID=215803 RepID=A0A0C2D5Q4_9BACT|nr:hypothetical protein DB30_03617 [Enhygromyxa salina]
MCASLVVAAGLGSGLGSGAAQAGGTKTHTLDDFDDFDDGEVVGAAIETSGRVTRGYASERAELELSSVFTCLTDGKQAWVGTADKATIQQVDLRGGAPAVKQLVELEGVVVSAIARLPSQDLVVAVLPGSKLLRVDKNGKVSDFAELKDVEQIWAIVPHKGKLLVATGPKGELWSVGTDGKDPKVVLDVPEKDILSVLAVGDEVLVGTSPKSRLYKLDSALEGVLLHEFKGDEIRALALSGSMVIAAVNKFEDRSVSSRVALTKQLNRSSLTGEKPEDNNTARARANADAELWAVDLAVSPGSKRDVLRAQDAAWDKWFTKKSQYFIDLIALDDSGTVLAASSEGGRIYRARGPRDVAIVADLEERQTTSMCMTDTGDVLATASDGAAVYLLSPKAANTKTKPRWVSDVLDASHPARYGSFALEGKGKLELRVRSGPTDEVDDRWSAWKSVKLNSENNELRGSTDLPQRRYLQVEVVLADDSAELTSVTAFYAPENLAPLLEEIDVKTPSVISSSDEEPDATITIEWDAEPRDEDDLMYEVAIRRSGSGDAGWVKLNKDEPITKKEIKLDLETLADGIYEVRVIASDEPSNGAGAAARDQLISEPFVIDRTRPTLDNVSASGGRVTGVAKDRGSYVRDVAFSIDGGAFRSATASDGLYDSSTEKFELMLPSELGPGVHRVVVRARDARGNLTTVALEVGG